MFDSVRLGDVADIVRGITFPTSAKKRKSARGLIACLRTTNVQNNVEWDDLLYVDESYVRGLDQLVQRNDILVSMSNSLELVGKCSLVTELPQEATFGAFLATVRVRPGIDPEYVFHAMRSASFRRHLRDVASTTTNISNINASKLLDAPLALCGIKNQRAIASRIDELFSEIEEGERALEKVRTLVERYRQSVLQAAVTGELTRDWREKHKDKLESGEALLARILKARREAWETAELAKMKAKGQKPSGPSWKAKYKDAVRPNIEGLPPLPAGWVWASLDQLSWHSNYGTSQKCGYDGSGMAVLRIPNVRSEGFSFEDLKFSYAPEVADEVDLVAAGDLLLIRTNGSESIVGAGAVVLSAPPVACYFASYLIRFRLSLSPTYAAWVNHCWDSQIVRSFVEGHRASSAGQYNISQSSLRELAIPIPPEKEAEAILDFIAERSASREHAAETVSRSSGGLARLRQSVLRQAFSGMLVPQDPADEPASVLLERIAAERAAASSSKKRPAGKPLHRTRKAKA